MIDYVYLVMSFVSIPQLLGRGQLRLDDFRADRCDYDHLCCC